MIKSLFFLSFLGLMSLTTLGLAQVDDRITYQESNEVLAQNQSGPTRAPIIISQDQTWSTPMQLLDDVIILQGVTLTITTTVECGQDVKFDIRIGAKMEVIGGTLTNIGKDIMWYGILVRGYRLDEQLPRLQGTLELRDATIEHAICAIGAGSYLYLPRSAAGGIVQAYNTVFRNNLVSVHYLSYLWQDNFGNVFDNVGYFRRCVFTIDDRNLFTRNGLNFENHARLEGVRGIKFYGCDFDLQTDEFFGIGIYSFSAGFLVDEECIAISPGVDCPCPILPTPSNFNNLHYGILSENAGDPMSIIVDQSSFDNNYNSIAINASNNFRVTRNYLNDVIFMGLRSDGSSGYRVEENYFKARRGLMRTIIGIMINNSGIAENRIYKNYLEEIDWGHGIYANGINGETDRPGRGLQFLCNTFEGNVTDIRINSGVVRLMQGRQTEGADNKFYNTGYSSFDNQTNHQIYYYHSPLVEHIPHNPINVRVDDTADFNKCQSTFCNNINRDGSMQENQENYLKLQFEYDNLVIEFNEAGYDYVIENLESDEMPEELIQEALQMLSIIDNLSNSMREISDNSISAIMQDSIMNVDMLKSWYQIVRTPIAKYALAETHFLTSDFDIADEVLFEIPYLFEFNDTEYAEYDNYMMFHNLKKKIHQNDRGWNELNDEEIKYLQIIAEANKGKSSTMAKGVLCFYYQICYEDEIEDEIFDSKSGETLSNKVLETIKESDGVSYNISDGVLTVILENAQKIEIFDMMGRKVIGDENSKNANLQIDISNLQAGIFILKIHTEDFLTKSEKFINK